MTMASDSGPPSKRRRANHCGDDNKTHDSSSLSGHSPVVVFAHGAGASSSSPWMIRWKELLSKGINAVEVVTFDYPYISGRKKRPPPKAEKLVEFHSDVVKRAMAKYPNHPLILVGKSMGARVSCMVAMNEDIHASAIVCLGYPLKGMNPAMREETLLQLKVPILFVQGSKDVLCPLGQLAEVRAKMKSPNEWHVVQWGDHSFKIGKMDLQWGSSQENAENAAAQAISAFISECLQGQ